MARALDLTKAVVCVECGRTVFIEPHRNPPSVTCLVCINAKRLKWGLKPIDSMYTQRDGDAGRPGSEKSR